MTGRAQFDNIAIGANLGGDAQVTIQATYALINKSEIGLGVFFDADDSTKTFEYYPGISLTNQFMLNLIDEWYLNLGLTIALEIDINKTLFVNLIDGKIGPAVGIEYHFNAPLNICFNYRPRFSFDILNEKFDTQLLGASLGLMYRF